LLFLEVKGSDNDANLDSVLLLESLVTDSEDVFYICLNNIKLEKPILLAIFNALKTTKHLRHLSLAGINMKDEEGLVSLNLSLL